MAKKGKMKSKKTLVKELPENMLPQNILPIGERVEENKNIYISQSVYKQIHKFTKNKTANESGGMLVGTLIEEFGKTNIVISGFVEAKFCEATPTTLKFTHDTWEYVHKEIEKRHKGGKILGWIHTHPDFGIFLSEYDKFIHQNFFSEDYQIAYVIDPIQRIEGFYFWVNGNLEKCRGFYIYDKTGTQINVDAGKDDSAGERPAERLFGIRNILIGLLSLAVILLFFANISANKKLEQMEKRQKILEEQQVVLTDSANQALFYLQQMIYEQDARIQELTGILWEAGLIPEGETARDPDADTAAGQTGDGQTADPTQGENTNE